MKQQSAFDQAFDAGAAAYEAGKPRGDTRDWIDVDEPAHAGWLCGWQEAEMQILERRARRAGEAAATYPQPCPYPQWQYRLREAWEQEWAAAVLYMAATKRSIRHQVQH